MKSIILNQLNPACDQPIVIPNAKAIKMTKARHAKHFSIELKKVRTMVYLVLALATLLKVLIKKSSNLKLLRNIPINTICLSHTLKNMIEKIMMKSK